MIITRLIDKFLLILAISYLQVFCPIRDNAAEDAEQKYSYVADKGRSSFKQIMTSNPYHIDEDHFAQYMMAAPGHIQRVDLSAGFPTPFTQGKLGSCTAVALISLLLYDMKKSAHESIESMSVLYLYYWSRFLESSEDYDAGVSLSDCIMAIQKFGICKESLWPYDIKKFTNRPSAEALQDAGASKDKFDMKRIKKVSQKLSVMKNMLNRQCPFACGIKIYESFESKEVERTGLVLMPEKNETYKGSHAVVFVGYDDNVNGGCFLVRNSWGPNWGTNFTCEHDKERGYFWLPYKYATNTKLAYDFWSMSSITNKQSDCDQEDSCFKNILKKIVKKIS